MPLGALLSAAQSGPEVNDEDHHRVREHVGNTHEVAKAIGDGIHEAHPGANVECVAMGDAAPELIKSTDLLIVGGPHKHGFTW